MRQPARMEMFAGVDRALGAELASGRLDRALAAWRRTHDVGGIETIEELIQCCRGPEFGTRRQKDAIAVALCMEACQDGDQRAGVLLCWLFLPGLSQLLQGLRLASTVEDEDDLIADLLAGFWEAASRVTPKSRFIARYLLLGARRYAKKAMRRASRAGVVTVDFNLDAHAGAAPVDDEVDDRIERALGEGIVSRSDVELVFSTRATIGEVAARYELSLGAAQQARHRARSRLADWLTQP